MNSYNFCKSCLDLLTEISAKIMFSKNIFTKLFFSASTKWLIYLDIYFITSFMLFIKGKPHK